jgi:peptidoglycan/LPS O-acetylase OafA/YrhL
MKRDNCFDALRISLALGVVYGHCFFLLGQANPLVAPSHGQVWIATECVVGFFGLSGYLISASWARSPSLGEFLRRRFLRIFPGFWACLVVSAFVFAPAISGVHHLHAFTFRDALAFVGKNAALKIRQKAVGATLTGNPYPWEIDGSLWSLWPEFTCYLITAGVGLLHGLTRNRALVILVMTVLLIVHLVALTNPSYPLLPTYLVLSHLTDFYLAFTTGVFLQLWKDLLLDRRGILFLGVAMLLMARNGGWMLLSPLLLPWLLISLGEAFRLHLPADLSYGTYLYGFPLQQLFVALNIPAHGWWLYLGLSVAGALTLGWLSWHLVERRFIAVRFAPA